MHPHTNAVCFDKNCNEQLCSKFNFTLKTMPFGEFKGVKINKLSTDYLSKIYYSGEPLRSIYPDVYSYFDTLDIKKILHVYKPCPCCVDMSYV